MKANANKIRLGDRVEHAIEELGIGTVWELRPNGLISVRWDRDVLERDAQGRRMLVAEGYSKRHYKAGNLIHAI